MLETRTERLGVLHSRSRYPLESSGAQKPRRSDPSKPSRDPLKRYDQWAILGSNHVPGLF
jgi:hypothetical protein